MLSGNLFCLFHEPFRFRQLRTTNQCFFFVKWVVVNAIGLATLLLFLIRASAELQETENSAESANEFARKVLVNEARAETQDQSHWMLRLETDKPQGKEVEQVVQTKYGELKRHVLLNGRALSTRQQHEEDERIQKLVHNPDALRKSMRDENEDSNRSQKMLKMLPDALIFSYGEHRGDTVELHFKSNPNFRPPSHEAQVFQALEGDIWVSSKQARLVELTGHLSREVKFGGGWLGHLNQGGQFEVKQTEVEPGYWELTLLNVNMKGKALFFKTVNVQQKMQRSQFRRVSDDLTLSQAAEILRKQAAVAQSADLDQK